MNPNAPGVGGGGGGSRRTGVMLAAAPGADRTEGPEKTAALEEPNEENLAKRSSVECLVAELLSAASKAVSLFIFIRGRAAHWRYTRAPPNWAL